MNEHRHVYVESPTIAERDSDGAFPTEFPVRWGRRPEESLFEGYFPNVSPGNTWSAIGAAVAILAVVALVIMYVEHHTV